MTSQRLAEGARCSKETQAATTPLPAYVVEFQSVFAKEDFDILPERSPSRRRSTPCPCWSKRSWTPS